MDVESTYKSHVFCAAQAARRHSILKHVDTPSYGNTLLAHRINASSPAFTFTSLDVSCFPLFFLFFDLYCSLQLVMLLESRRRRERKTTSVQKDLDRLVCCRYLSTVCLPEVAANSRPHGCALADGFNIGTSHFAGFQYRDGPRRCSVCFLLYFFLCPPCGTSGPTIWSVGVRMLIAEMIFFLWWIIFWDWDNNYSRNYPS